MFDYIPPKIRDSIVLGGDDEPKAKKSKVVLADEEAFLSGDELPKESSEKYLCWRNDSAFSDWKIVINVSKSSSDDANGKKGESDSSKEVTYHVHKAALAFGPRRSEYFVRLFDNDGAFAESHDNTSRIVLHELAAKAFPEFLDYVYMAGKKVVCTADNATALYSLAKYFDVRPLRLEVKKFCLENMQNSIHCGTYYEHAKILQMESILGAAKKSCTTFAHNIKDDARLLHVTDMQFWIDLMEEQNKQAHCSILSYSQRV
jgi:BTB/POZ domain